MGGFFLTAIPYLTEDSAIFQTKLRTNTVPGRSHALLPHILHIDPSHLIGHICLPDHPYD